MSVETLLSVPLNVAVEAGYLAIRALKHLSVSVISADTPFGEESIAAQKLAEQIIDDIASVERRPVPGLDRARVDYYISKISEAVQTRMRDAVGIDAARGDALLAELRSDEAHRY
jgi:molybdopterin-guanine dinucleotide biosynthesis protein A